MAQSLWQTIKEYIASLLGKTNGIQAVETHAQEVEQSRTNHQVDLQPQHETVRAGATKRPSERVEIMFARAVEFVLGEEGGYVNDPQDPGGETRYGISKRAYPELDIEGLTREQAIKIYKDDYWDANEVGRLPRNVQVAFFDCCVNSGATQAKKLLQRTAGVTEDGIIGMQTITACNMYRGILYTDYLAERALFYSKLKHYDRFGRGWQRRLFRVSSFTTKLGVID